MITINNVELIETALLSAWGQEWLDLPMKKKWAIADDFEKANSEEGTSATEYRHAIWRGNLERYADCLLVKS